MKRFIEGIMICGSVILGASVVLVGGIKYVAEKIEEQIKKEKKK